MSDPENYAAGSTDVTMHMEIVFRGAYAYYLQHYLKWFKRDQILILNANLLKTNPAKLLIQTQGKFNREIPYIEKVVGKMRSWKIFSWKF